MDSDRAIIEDDIGKCQVCSVEVKGQDKGVSCDFCQKWFHAKCVEITPELYKCMKKFDGSRLGTALHWYCKNCNIVVCKILPSISEIKLKQDKIETEVENLKKEVEQIKIVLAENKKSYADAVKAGGEMAEIQGRQGCYVESDRKIQIQLFEVIEKEKKKNNLVIMGLPEMDNDGDIKNTIGEILNYVTEEENCEFEFMERIGKKGERARPTRIKINNIASKIKILKNANRLKRNNQMDKIYITPDLTRKQQEEEKKLRDKLKSYKLQGLENVRIQKGQIVKEVDGQREILYSIGN